MWRASVREGGAVRPPVFPDLHLPPEQHRTVSQTEDYQYHRPILHCFSCHPWTGECFCKPGYSGSHCHRHCPILYHGPGCSNLCTCQNSAYCDHVNGSCLCSPGWVGDTCSEACPEGRHGPGCNQECKCQNGASCDPTNGKCDCTAGWTGKSDKVIEYM